MDDEEYVASRVKRKVCEQKKDKCASLTTVDVAINPSCQGKDRLE